MGKSSDQDLPNLSKTAPVWTARAVPLAAISGELDRLWHQAHTALANTGSAAPEGIPSVARARVLNLIAYAADDAHARRVENLMEQLATRHPSRTVIVVAHGEEPGAPEGAIHATITMRAHAGAEGRRVLDALVRLDTYGAVEERLPSVIVPLLVPDLPTFLWWSGDPPASLAAWRRMVDLCDRLVVDSADFLAPASMARFADFVRGAQRAPRRFHTFADLAWHRLRPWRDLLAQCFDHPRYRSCLETVEEARIVSAGPSEALLLAGWLCAALGWEATAAHRLDPALTESAASFSCRYDLVGWPSGRALTLIVEPAPLAASRSGIARVALLAQTGAGDAARRVRFVVSREGQMLHVTVEEPRTRHTAPSGVPSGPPLGAGVAAGPAAIDPAEEYGAASGTLLGRELETLGQDETYEAALAAGYPLGTALAGILQSGTT